MRPSGWSAPLRAPRTVSESLRGIPARGGPYRYRARGKTRLRVSLSQEMPSYGRATVAGRVSPSSPTALGDWFLGRLCVTCAPSLSKTNIEPRFAAWCGQKPPAEELTVLDTCRIDHVPTFHCFIDSAQQHRLSRSAMRGDNQILALRNTNAVASVGHERVRSRPKAMRAFQYRLFVGRPASSGFEKVVLFDAIELIE